MLSDEVGEYGGSEDVSGYLSWNLVQYITGIDAVQYPHLPFTIGGVHMNKLFAAHSENRFDIRRYASITRRAV
jgi:hypothetical protein